MVAGHLTLKNGRYYAVLNYRNAGGQRKTKWISLGLPEKGNKRKTEAELARLRAEFEPPKEVGDLSSDMATDYTYLYEEYPEVISADQLYRICHISKRKAKWLLEHGYIPCEDSGKKTRRYKIRLNDVIDYLLTLEAAPDLVATPVGAFNVKRKQLNPVAQICQKGFQRFLYNIWTDEADILRISDVQVLLGYSAGTIRQWILRKELRSTRLPCGIQVTAKEWLIDFTVRYTIKNPSHLSITHRKLVEQHFCDCSQKCN